MVSLEGVASSSHTLGGFDPISPEIVNVPRLEDLCFSGYVWSEEPKDILVTSCVNRTKSKLLLERISAVCIYLDIGIRETSYASHGSEILDKYVTLIISIRSTVIGSHT